MRTLITTTVVSAALLIFAACSDDETPANTSSTSSSSSSSGSTSTSSGASGTSGASSGTSGASSGTSGASSGTSGTSGTSDGGSFAITSTAYMEGGTIPKKHECVTAGAGAESKSPPLAWSGAPSGTMSYAIVMRDLDFTPQGAPFIHWVIWDIPGTATSLPEGVEQTANPANVAGAKQAAFNGQIIGYQGPCSPSSVNNYEITIYSIPTATMSGITTATGKVEAAAAIVSAATASAKLAGKS